MDNKQLLEALLLDEDFLNLPQYEHPANTFMDIFKIKRRELPHSNFLAWLFNPKGEHNLGDLALKIFIQLYFKNNPHQPFGKDESTALSLLDFASMDFDDLKIKREHKNIDLLLISPKNSLCVVIENKINAKERGEQLGKYQNIAKIYKYKYTIYIYISLASQAISNKNYIQLTYLHIVSVLNQILAKYTAQIPEQYASFISNYLQSLQTMLPNEELQKIARELYKKHQQAFDLVFKYKEKSIIEFYKYIENLVKLEKKIIPLKGSKNAIIRFKPTYFNNTTTLHQKGFSEINDGNNITKNWVFLFEFDFREIDFANIGKYPIVFNFVIGAGKTEHRQKLYALCQEHLDVFNGNLKTTLQDWHIVFSKPILTYTEFAEVSVEEIYKIIETRFNELVKIDLPKIIDCFEKELK
jgi:PD-(D/E)XK nuclease superfamily